MSDKKVNRQQVVKAKNILILIEREYFEDLSDRYRASLSDVVALLKDIGEDLQERE